VVYKSCGAGGGRPWELPLAALDATENSGFELGVSDCGGVPLNLAISESGAEVAWRQDPRSGSKNFNKDEHGKNSRVPTTFGFAAGFAKASRACLSNQALPGAGLAASHALDPVGRQGLIGQTRHRCHGACVGARADFLIKRQGSYAIPLVVEEPSIVAGAELAAKIARAGAASGSKASEPILIADPSSLTYRIRSARQGGTVAA